MPNHYPQEATLRDGRRVLIRPFAANDTGDLYDFFQRLDTDARRFAWDHLDDRALIDSWGRNLDYSKVLPLLAIDEARRVVADATLHERDSGPLRLVGRIKWLIDKDYRGIGLGTLLVNQFITIARERGLRQLTAMLISDLEAEAIRVLRNLGFESYVIPGYGTDPDGNQHDMTKLVFKL